MTDVFKDFDLSDFWKPPEPTKRKRGRRTNAPFTEEQLVQVERQIGYRLPASYVALMRTQNGGYPKRNCYPSTETGWAEDHVQVRELLGIDRGLYSRDVLGSRYMIEEWGYPKIGIYIGSTPSGGHEALMLDYRACGRRGEPSVVYIDQEADYRLVQLAPDFETFIRGLVDKSVYDTSAEDLKRDLLKIQQDRFSPALEQLLSTSATPKETEASLRKLLQAVAIEKGRFNLHDDPGSCLVFDVLFLLQSEARRIVVPHEFFATYPGLIALTEGVSTGGFSPRWIESWMRSRLKAGDIVSSEGRLLLSEDHRRSVLDSLASYG